PVTMEVKQNVEIPSLAVVLSIDRSGSMAMATDEKVTKLDLAKEAAHLVVDLLDERNEVGVMSWDTEFVWDAPVRPARDRQAIHHAIATIKEIGRASCRERGENRVGARRQKEISEEKRG